MQLSNQAFSLLLHSRLLCATFSAVFQHAITGNQQMSLHGRYRVTDASTML